MPMNKHLLRANDELVDYFTSALGVRAQNMAADPTGGDGDGLEGLLVREIDQANLHDRRTSIAKYDAVRSTLAATEPGARRILELVYTPFGTGFTPPKRKAPKARFEQDEAPDFLATALTPNEGNGSYVRLALTMSRTIDTYTKRYPDKDAPTPAMLLMFLQFEAGRGEDSASFFKALREDCESPRMQALRAYDEHRRVRRPAEVKDDEARAARKAKNEYAYFMRQLRGVE